MIYTREKTSYPWARGVIDVIRQEWRYEYDGTINYTVRVYAGRRCNANLLTEEVRFVLSDAEVILRHVLMTESILKIPQHATIEEKIDMYDIEGRLCGILEDVERW